MNRDDDPLMTLLRQIEPPVSHLTETLTPTTARQMVDDIVRSEPSRPRQRRRLVQVSAASLGLALAAAGTAAAVQALTSPEQTVQVLCNVPDGPYQGTADISGPTGDPVADCTTWWRNRLKTEPPALAAFQDKYGQIQVTPASQPVPADWKPLPGGVVQDTEQILLNEALLDEVDGLHARCYTQANAVQKAQALVTASGFADWPVVVDAAVNDYPAPNCWDAFANPIKHQVVINNIPSIEQNYAPEVFRLAAGLRASQAECWDLPTAVTRAKQALAASGFSAEDQAVTEIREVPTAGAQCTTVHLVSGGAGIITLRGPAN